MISLHTTGSRPVKRETGNRIGSSDVSGYCPFYCFANGILSRNNLLDIVVDEDNSDKKSGYIWYLPDNTSNLSVITNYSKLLNSLAVCLHLKKYTYTLTGETHTLKVMKGYIGDEEGNTLLITVSNKSKINSIDDIPNKVKILLNKDFMSNPIYKNVYRKIFSEYIQPALDIGVGLYVTSNEEINEMVFSNSFNTSDFNSITELKQKLNNILSNTSIMGD